MIRQIHLTLGAFALFAVAFGAMLMGSAGDSYAAPSLVPNGGFATDTSQWSVPVPATTDLDWDSADVAGNPDSGSAIVTYLDDAGAGDVEVESACIDTSGIGAGFFAYSGFARKGALWTTGATTGLRFEQYDSADCTGAAAFASSPDDNDLGVGNGWIQFSGGAEITSVSASQSIRVFIRLHGIAQNDAAQWDEIALAYEAGSTTTPVIDTPTPFNTVTPAPTNTPVATNTPAATNTPLPTDTPVATSTPVATDTPVATNTAEPTSTTVPPTNTPETLEVGAPPEAELDNTGSAGAGGEEPEGSAGAGEEEPEAGEVPESGYGPDSYSNERSHVADIVALVSFTLAIIMLGAGFALRKNYEEA